MELRSEMTPMMSLFLRCLLAFMLVLVLLALTDYAMAAPIPLSRPATSVHLGLLRPGVP